MGYDLYPMDTLAAKKAFVAEAIEKNMLVFFEHDPAVAAGYIREDARETPDRSGAVLSMRMDGRVDTSWQFKLESSAAAACTTWPS